MPTNNSRNSASRNVAAHNVAAHNVAAAAAASLNTNTRRTSTASSRRTSSPSSRRTSTNNTTSSSLLPLSGSERPFTNTTFGTPRGVGNNNCYAWAIDRYRNAGETKLQPGNMSGAKNSVDLNSCSSVTDRALRDLKNRAYAASAETPCRAGYYKIMAFLAKGNDYHWYRQHKDVLVKTSSVMRSASNVARNLGVGAGQVYTGGTPRLGDTVLVKNAGLWSHKQGFATAPILKDACGKPIQDPRRACRKYSDTLNYTDYCGSICVRGESSDRSLDAGAKQARARNVARNLNTNNARR